MPQGCSVAPDTTDSRVVVGNYNWNAQVVVLSSGKPYCTKNFATDGACAGHGGLCAGCQLNQGWLLPANGKYRSRHCNGQILYQCTDYTGTGDTTITTIHIDAPTSAPDLCHRPRLRFISSL